jgi:hypothetical protein
MPALANTIITVLILNLAKIMNLFESVFVLQNDSVMDVSQVLQTYVYYQTFNSGGIPDYGYTTALGLFRSLVGLCLMLMLIAAATALMVMSSKKKTGEAAFVQSAAYSSSDSRRSEQTQKQIKTIGIINLVICLSVYLVVSFLTGAWIITWLLFPLFACIHGLIVACIDLKEAT